MLDFARSTSWSRFQLDFATPTIGLSRRPFFTSDWRAGKIFLYARSPVAPKKTSASDGGALLMEARVNGSERPATGRRARPFTWRPVASRDHVNSEVAEGLRRASRNAPRRFAPGLSRRGLVLSAVHAERVRAGCTGHVGVPARDDVGGRSRRTTRLRSRAHEDAPVQRVPVLHEQQPAVERAGLEVLLRRHRARMPDHGAR